MNKEISIRDLIYFDFEKAASLFSQLEGGLPDKISESHESIGSQEGKLKFNFFSTFKSEFGDMSSDKHSVLEAKVLHHDLLNRIESSLSKLGMVSDLNKLKSQIPSEPTTIHKAIGETPYIQAEGWTLFEDYSRINDITNSFNDLVAFVTRCGLGELEKDLQGERKLQKNENEVKKLLKNELKGRKLPEWLFNGLQLWIETFMKDRLNLTIVPFDKCPSVELLCNLKRDCFVDDDIKHILYGYGTRPNIKLSVFGLITSMPPEDENELNIFDNSENNDEDSGEDEDRERKRVFEKGFRGLFPAIEGLESFSTYHRYPRIILHPIAVYRDIKATLPKQS